MSGMLESDLGTLGRICLELMFYVVGFQLAALAHIMLCVWKMIRAGLVEHDPFEFECQMMRGGNLFMLWIAAELVTIVLRGLIEWGATNG